MWIKKLIICKIAIIKTENVLTITSFQVDLFRTNLSTNLQHQILDAVRMQFSYARVPYVSSPSISARVPEVVVGF